jgi:hypothetical protein
MMNEIRYISQFHGEIVLEDSFYTIRVSFGAWHPIPSVDYAKIVMNSEQYDATLGKSNIKCTHCFGAPR